MIVGVEVIDKVGQYRDSGIEPDALARVEDAQQVFKCGCPPDSPVLNQRFPCSCQLEEHRTAVTGIRLAHNQAGSLQAAD